MCDIHKHELWSNGTVAFPDWVKGHKHRNLGGFSDGQRVDALEKIVHLDMEYVPKDETVGPTEGA
jgi:hypothetical protein